MEGSFLVSSSTESVLEHGRRLLSVHFKGEPFGWRVGGPSLRSLSQDHDVSLSSMYRCVATASVWIECGAPNLAHLTVSHLRELLAVEGADRRELFEQAEKGQWTVARLRRACDELKEPAESNGRGRPRRQPELDFALQTVRSWVSNPDRLDGFEALRSLGECERARMLRAVKTMILELEMMRYRLEP